ncbi:MAG: DNA polymerase I [Rhodospirillales bacterium]|nr:DNA polymerase I [Rhodospirillales bacterium]
MNDHTSEPDREHLFIVDGSGFIFRAYFAGMAQRRSQMTRSDGTPTNAVYIYTRMMLKLIEDTEADYVAVIFDKARKTFRNDIYPEYKAHRPEPPEDLIPQFALVREATEAMNVPAIQMENYEADDLIATYATQAAERGMDVTIVSSDKDLMQLVNDRVSLWDGMKEQTIGAAEVFEKFGVTPDKVIEVQSLAGDSTDNVPGVQGIGIKTAAELINEYGDLESLLARAEEIKQPKRREKLIEQADLARISKQLVTLMTNVPDVVPLDEFRKRQPDPEKLLTFLREMEFKSLVSSISAKHGPKNEDTSAQPATEEKPAEISYTLVQKMADLLPWIAAAEKAGIVAVDTETDALSSMQAGLVGISLSIESGKACYIPLAHVGSGAQGAFDLGDSDGVHEADAPEQIPLKDAIKALKPMLEDPSILKVGQNIKYDIQVLSRYGVDVAPVDDTMLLSYVLEGGLHGHGMDELSLRFLDHATIKFKDVAGTGKAAVSFDKVALEQAGPYAAEDADVTLRLHRVLKPRLTQEHMVGIYERLERPLIHILERMERTGIKVDAKKLKAFSADFEKRMGEFEVHARELAGRDFNIGSPKQVGEILFDEMSLDGGKKGKTGAYSTSAEVLEELAAQGHELPQTILDWRQLQKLKSTYTDALVDTINPATGRVHTSFSQAITSTGRLSSNDPNLQNIPIRSEEGRKIRQAFIADDGFTLMSADYSQIELRLLAHVADIEVLKQAFADGQDIHAITASQVFGVPVEGMDPMIRRQAKAINFGIIYGISGFGLARQLGISRGDAQRYIDAYFERYPGIKNYMERTKQQAHDHGFVMTPFGRKCHMRGINEKNQGLRGNAERAAINAPIQGGAADIIKRAMSQLPAALDDAKLGARMLLQVHDELIFEVPDAEIDATRSVVKQVMESAATLNVPLVVDIGTGSNWDEAH